MAGIRLVRGPYLLANFGNQFVLVKQFLSIQVIWTNEIANFVKTFTRQPSIIAEGVGLEQIRYFLNADFSLVKKFEAALNELPPSDRIGI